MLHHELSKLSFTKQAASGIADQYTPEVPNTFFLLPGTAARDCAVDSTPRALEPDTAKGTYPELGRFSRVPQATTEFFHRERGSEAEKNTVHRCKGRGQSGVLEDGSGPRTAKNARGLYEQGKAGDSFSPEASDEAAPLTPRCRPCGAARGLPTPRTPRRSMSAVWPPCVWHQETNTTATAPPEPLASLSLAPGQLSPSGRRTGATPRPHQDHASRTRSVSQNKTLGKQTSAGWHMKTTWQGPENPKSL